MRNVIFLYSYSGFAYNFTKEIVDSYLKNDFKVTIVFPDNEYQEEFIKMGCDVVNIKLSRRGTNVFKDYGLYKSYKKLFKEIKPELVFGFSIKPNIFGAQAAKKYKIPFISRISGLGTSFQKKNHVYYITKFLYKHAFSKIEHVFFENEKNAEIFENSIRYFDNSTIIPGSGVNLEDFIYQPFPTEEEPVKFLFIGRLMREKGIEEYLYTAEVLKNKYGSKVEFHIIGDYEEDYYQRVTNLKNKDIVKYHGLVKDVSSFIAKSHCIVLPSHHEGMSNALLEAQASGRAVIGSNINGVIETFDNNISGFQFEVGDANDLILKTEEFINMGYDKQKEFGVKGREKMENEFSRQIVIDEYMKFIK